MKSYVLGLVFIVGLSFMACDTSFGKDLARPQALSMLKKLNHGYIIKRIPVKIERQLHMGDFNSPEDYKQESQQSLVKLMTENEAFLNPLRNNGFIEYTKNIVNSETMGSYYSMVVYDVSYTGKLAPYILNYNNYPESVRA